MSISDAIDDILSVERPFERRDVFGAGGGGFCGLLTKASLSAFLQSEDMTSLFPAIDNALSITSSSPEAYKKQVKYNRLNRMKYFYRFNKKITKIY